MRNLHITLYIMYFINTIYYYYEINSDKTTNNFF